jgi:hypothetical protein
MHSPTERACSGRGWRRDVAEPALDLGGELERPVEGDDVPRVEGRHAHRDLLVVEERDVSTGATHYAYNCAVLRRLVLLALVTIALGGGCAEPASQPAPSSEQSAVAELIESASTPAPPASWPTDVEDLATSLARLTTREACLAALRERTPTAISEAIGDLSYDGFFEDVCTSLEAVRDHAPARCADVVTSTMRRGCLFRVAIVSGQPDACPPARSIEGRDPLCVAWAARDPGLCRAVAVAERATCEAGLAADEGRCRARGELDPERCRAWTRRYASALGTERHRSAIPGDTALSIELVRVIPTADRSAPSVSEPTTVELPVLARGVHLRADGCAYRVVLDDRGDHAAPVSLSRPSARVELRIAAGEPPLTIDLARETATISIAHPELGRAEDGEGTITIDALARERGAALTGSFSATLPHTPGALRVRGTFRTFVRDLDPLPASCAVADPPIAGRPP